MLFKIRKTKMIHMDGKSPSGFKNSTFKGMILGEEEKSENKFDPNKIEVKSFYDAILKSQDFW